MKSVFEFTREFINHLSSVVDKNVRSNKEFETFVSQLSSQEQAEAVIKTFSQYLVNVSIVLSKIELFGQFSDSKVAVEIPAFLL